jgi:diguanylate cyclase (GGDEF)-like protein/PAS domain S-box-containing protein
MKQHRPHFLVFGLLLAVLLTGSHDALRHLVTDGRFALFPRDATGDVVLVAIDAGSIEKVGVWPWPRRLHAEIIGKLHAAGASEIAFDIDFSSPSGDSSDLAFADALRKAGGSVVLPSFKQLTSDRNVGKRIHYAQPLAEFREHSWSAVVNVPVDSDGLVRRYPFGEQFDGLFVPSLARMLGSQHQLRSGTFLIDYGIRASTVPTISYIDVLHGDNSALKRLVSNKKAIIGATALELGDRVNVPRGQIMPGAILQALAAESILQGRALQDAPIILSLAGVLAISIMMFGTWRRLSYWRRAALLVATAVVAESGAIWIQANWPLVLDTGLLHLTTLGYLVAGAIYEIDLRGLLGRIANTRFQRIAMSVGDGLVCVDQKGMITFWNPGAATMFGYSPGEMLGKSAGNLLMKETDGGTRSPLVFNAELIGSAVGKVLELEGRRKNGQSFPIDARLFGWEGTNGVEYGALLRDISLRKRHIERIQYLAQVDILTGLANRHTLREHLDAMLMLAEAEHGEVALLVLDLDKFKDVNDSLGHTGGDELLAAVAGRLRDIPIEGGMVARLGGDEFAIVVSGPQIDDVAETLAEQAIDAIKGEAFSIQGRQLAIRCSIGIAIYPTDTTSPEELLSGADLALYQAKAQGGGIWNFFTQEIKDALATKLSLQSELDRALKRDELELFYQPQVSLADGRLIGAEALIRWRHPERGLLYPAEFMPAVHTSAFSNDVAWWVMETACRRSREWERSGFSIPVGVNLSPSQFQVDNFTETVVKVLNRTGLSPRLLEIEVTEDILLNDDERAAEIFARLRDAGVRLAFDDFGTGYGSLSYLKKFPFDRLKIDRSFVRALCAGTDDAAIVSSTIALSKLLGLSVIAEGIENAATADLLVSMGCNEGQGYFYGRPVPAGEFEQRWLSREIADAPNALAADAA